MNFKDIGRAIAKDLTSDRQRRQALRVLTRAGLLPDSVWTRLPAATTFGVELPEGRSFHYSAIGDEIIGRALHWRGIDGFEPEVLDIWFNLARNARTILDIGAHTGTFSLIACAANPAATAWAFEPIPRIRARLKLNVEINGWAERLHVMPCAVSDTCGTAMMQTPDANALPGTSSLSHEATSHTFEVPVATIDSLPIDHATVDLVKMDVEGFEDYVLRGMVKTFDLASPTLVIECNPDGPYEAVDAFLKARQYHSYHLTARGPVFRDKVVPGDNATSRNYLFLPARHHDFVTTGN